MSIKRCSKCDQDKPITDFHKQSRAKDGHHPYCKTCNIAARTAWEKPNKARAREHSRNHWLRKAYGLTPEDYAAMFAAQGGVCASCKRPPRTSWPLCVDHCHATGAVRALLCQTCNSMLGMADDIPEYLEAGAAYLRLHASAHGNSQHPTHT